MTTNQLRRRSTALAAAVALLSAWAAGPAGASPSDDSAETVRERQDALRANRETAPRPVPPALAAPSPLAPAPPFRPLFAGVDNTGIAQVRINVDDGSPFLAFSGYSVWGAAYDPTSDVVYFNSGTTLYRWPVGGAVETLGQITLDANPLSVVGLAFYAGHLYASTNTGNEGIYEIDTTTRAATLVIDYADDEYDFGGIDIDPRTGILYGTNDDATPHGVGLYRINPDGTATLVTPYPDSQTDIDGLAVGRGRAYLIIDEPGSFYVYDFATSSFKTPIAAPWATTNLFAAGAWIDDLLFDSDFETYPPDWSAVSPARCSGHCVASGTPDNICYCDNLCLGLHDCCLDACSTCGICP